MDLIAPGKEGRTFQSLLIAFYTAADYNIIITSTSMQMTSYYTYEILNRLFIQYNTSKLMSVLFVRERGQIVSVVMICGLLLSNCIIFNCNSDYLAHTIVLHPSTLFRLSCSMFSFVFMFFSQCFGTFLAYCFLDFGLVLVFDCGS